MLESGKSGTKYANKMGSNFPFDILNGTNHKMAKMAKWYKNLFIWWIVIVFIIAECVIVNMAKFYVSCGHKCIKYNHFMKFG